MKLWGGRFETGPSEVFERFSGSLHFDRRLIDADIRGSQAFARALGRVGILQRDEVEPARRGVRRDRRRSAAAAFFDGATDEDVHTLVIRKLKEKVGGLADKIHTGRSRNEQVSLDTRLWLREEIDAAKAELTAFMRALLELAREISGRGDPRLYASAARAGRAVAALPAGVLRDVRARLGAAR